MPFCWPCRFGATEGKLFPGPGGYQFAFIEFPSVKKATNALTNLNGSKHLYICADNVPIKMRYAKGKGGTDHSKHDEITQEECE
jgi:hypothetical protein